MKKDKKAILKIEFDNKELMDVFASWLCNHGEQEYFMCMEENNEDNVCITEFRYHDKNDKWLGDLTIRTKSGKLND